MIHHAIKVHMDFLLLLFIIYLTYTKIDCALRGSAAGVMKQRTGRSVL